MAEGFLQVIERAQKQGGLGGGQVGDYAGDQYGGAGGKDGSGLPSAAPANFWFATGIECSYPTILDASGQTVRRDQLAECGHYERWAEDFALVHDLGLNYLRYGLPYHKVHLGPGRYDWDFADLVMAELRRLKITPILDLLHFGLPDWLGDFQNPELPVHFAAYAGEVARRYPWVRHYTPVNEMYVTARSSTLDGIWNERLKTDAAFVTATKHVVAASILACQAIVQARNNAIIVQSESAEYVHDAHPSPRPEIHLHNRLACLSLDLLYAHAPDADVMLYLLDNGLTRQEYDWFMAGEPPGHQILGNDYYGRNERICLPDGREVVAESVLGWHTLARRYYHRYRKPVMHTETNTFDAAAAPGWLWQQWVNVLNLRAEGVPVVGFTWYSLTDQIDWDTSLAQQNGHVNPVGLYDLNRQIRPVGAAYKDLLAAFGQITLVPHGEMFEFTEDPANLKVEV